MIVKGRELVALAMQSFRTSDRRDLLYHIEHLFNLDVPGDKNLVVFRNKWYDFLLKMSNEDKPRPLALRDILHSKINGSKKMEFGLNAYHRLPDKHPQKSHEFLLTLIDYKIKSDREDLMLDMEEKSVKPMMKSGGKDAAPPAEKQGRRCRRLLDPLGNHRAACARSGGLRGRVCPLKGAPRGFAVRRGPVSHATPIWQQVNDKA